MDKEDGSASATLMMPSLGDLTGVVGAVTRALEYASDLKTNKIQLEDIGCMRYLLRSVDVSTTLMRYCYKFVNGITFDGRKWEHAL